MLIWVGGKSGQSCFIRQNNFEYVFLALFGSKQKNIGKTSQCQSTLLASMTKSCEKSKGLTINVIP